MRAAIFLALAMSAVAWAPASSQEEDEWRLILAIPGAVETSHTDIFGHRVYNIHFPSGVHFQRDDYQRRIVGIDESKSGPVLCARMFMIASISALQLCPVNNRDALMAELDSALDRVDEFIAANGWKPTSKEQERKKRNLQKLPAPRQRTFQRVRFACAQSSPRE